MKEEVSHLVSHDSDPAPTPSLELPAKERHPARTPSFAYPHPHYRLPAPSPSSPRLPTLPASLPRTPTIVSPHPDAGPVYVVRDGGEYTRRRQPTFITSCGLNKALSFRAQPRNLRPPFASRAILPPVPGVCPTPPTGPVSPALNHEPLHPLNAVIHQQRCPPVRGLGHVAKKITTEAVPTRRGVGMWAPVGLVWGNG